MALHNQAQAAYGPGLGSAFQDAVNIKQGLGVIQKQKAQMAQMQNQSSAEEKFAQIAGQFKGNPSGALDYMVQNRLISPMQYTTAIQGIQEQEQKAKAEDLAQAERQVGSERDLTQRMALAKQAQEYGASGPELGAVLTGAQDAKFVSDLAIGDAKAPKNIKFNQGTGEQLVQNPDGTFSVLKHPNWTAPQESEGQKVGSAPYVFTKRDGRYIVTMKWNPKLGKHEEVGRGLASSTDIAKGDQDITTIAQKTLRGKLDPNYLSKRGGVRKALIAEMDRLEPGVNVNDLQARFKARTDVQLNKSIAVLDSLVSPIDNNPSLLDQLEAEHAKLGFKEDAKAFNIARRFALDQLNSPELKAYDNLRNSLVFELTQALTAAAPTDQRVKTELENFPKSPSPKQMRAIVEKTMEIVGARRGAFMKAQGRGLEQNVAPQAAIEYLRAHPEARDMFKQKYGYVPEGM